MLKIESTQKGHTMKQFSVEITLNEKSANINQIENAIDQIFLNLKIGNTELGINSKLISQKENNVIYTITYNIGKTTRPTKYLIELQAIANVLNFTFKCYSFDNYSYNKYIINKIKEGFAFYNLPK